MRVTVLGCGDAFGSGGRFNTSFHLRLHDDRRVLIDFGATTMVALRQQGIDPDSIDSVVISHLHGDHFGGLPFFLLHLQYNAQRSRPLTIAGPPEVGETVKKALAVFFGGIRPSWGFPMRFVEMSPGASVDLDGLSVTPFPVVHGNVTSHALRIVDGGTVLAYSGDTAWTDVLYEVADKADLFIMECYDYDCFCPTHTDWRTLQRHLPGLTAKRVALTHLNSTMLSHRAEATVEVLDDGKVMDI